MSSFHRSKVVAVVAAYNEAPRISQVLEVLTSYPGFDAVIVVDDGSTDGTADVAARYGVLLLRQENKGKGAAMELGVQASEADVIFFCDADVCGLTHRIIEQTLKPVLTGKLDMMIAMRNRTIYFVRLILRGIPLLGGERAVRREFWDGVPARYKDRFMIEAALNFYAHLGTGYGYKVFPGLTQTIKEKKYGVLHGIIARFKMIFDVIKAQVLLRFHNREINIRSKADE